MIPLSNDHRLRHSLRPVAMIFVASLVAACAPSGPIVKDGPSQRTTLGVEMTPQVEERMAQTANERADSAVQYIGSQSNRRNISAYEVLEILEPYSLNELRWQAQTNRSQPFVAALLDLAVVVHTDRINPNAFEQSLSQWQRLHRRQFDTMLWADQASAWVSQWRSRVHGPRSVGVVLPKSPALERAGEAIQDGMLETWLTLPTNVRPEIIFYYVDDNNPAELDRVIRRAQDDRVDWLIGPLARDQVDQVLQMRSSQWPIPTLLLNTPSNPRLTRRLNDQRLSFALRPEADAQQAAQYASALNLDRALVLAQDTSWGQRMASGFADTFRSLGRRVIEVAWYDPDAVDHSILLELVLGLNDSRQRIAEIENLVGSSVVAEPQRRQDIEMIFLAARADDARQIRPQLQFFRADDLPVVSVSYAIDGAVDARRDVDLDGVILPMAPWFVDNTSAGQLRLQAERRHPSLSTNSSLSHLHAMGRDLIQLMRYLEPMKKDQQLALRGMTGNLTISSSGEINRVLLPIRIQNGQSEINTLR